MVNEKIKELRLLKGWSQQELAEKTGYKDKSSISLIEKGQTDITQTMLKKFAEVFGVEPTYFFDFEQDYTLNHLLYEKSKSLSQEQILTLLKLMESMK